MNLYYNPGEGTIEDDDGKKYTVDEAKFLLESGKVKDCNLAFERLMTFNFDIQKLENYYDEVKINRTGLDNKNEPC